MVRGKSIAILLVLVIMAGAAYADFSADMVTKARGVTQTAKIFVKGDNTRIEMPGAALVIIARGDKKVTWLLSPKTKTYREMTGAQTKHGSAYYDRVPGIQRLGKEKANGYLCSKYAIRTQGKVPATTTIWVSDELSMEVKAVTQTAGGAQSLDLTNIRKRWLWNGSLFNLPKGYKKVG
jgi:hypothetical protein